jgi:hypothetical protein
MSPPGLSASAGVASFPRWRKAAALLGVLALLSQTFVLLVHRPPSAVLAATAMAMAMGPDCPMMMDGTAMNPPTPDKSDDTDSKPRKAPPVCPICQSLQLSGLFVTPVHPVIFAALSVVTVRGLVEAAQRTETVTNERARSRAPPSLPEERAIDG